MLPINETAAALGLTTRQTYRRVSSLRPLLAPFIRRGEKGKLLLDGSALEILRRAESLRREGLSINEAMTTIREEISGNGEGEQEKATGNGELVEALKRENEHLRSEVAWLRSRVDQLTPLALPRRPRWFAWFRPLSHHTHSTRPDRLRAIAAFSFDLWAFSDANYFILPFMLFCTFNALV